MYIITLNYLFNFYNIWLTRIFCFVLWPYGEGSAKVFTYFCLLYLVTFSCLEDNRAVATSVQGSCFVSPYSDLILYENLCDKSVGSTVWSFVICDPDINSQISANCWMNFFCDFDTGGCLVFFFLVSIVQIFFYWLDINNFLNNYKVVL